jgi:hypothetical protein
VVLSALEAGWVLPAALAACGLMFLGDAASESGPRQHTAETFFLNFLSLPLGAFALLVGALDALHTDHLTLGFGAGIAIGAILMGRSLREVPWTGVVSLGAGAAVGWFLVEHSPWALSLLDILAASAIVFVLVFILLYLIELPLRLAGLLALPRPLLIVLGVASFVTGGYLFLFGLA